MAIKTYVYKTVDSEQQLEADVHYPTTKSSQIIPIALLIHGGGFTAGGKEHIPQNQFETLLELGFVAVSVNYRLCPTISVYDGPFTDSKDCYAWCKSTLPELLRKDTGVIVDPFRLVVLGHSAGANLALLMATNPEPPLAILDFYGAKYLSDDFWYTPKPNLPQLDLPEEFINKIWSEIPPPSSTLIHQSQLAGQASQIDLSQPRNAWLFSSIRNGTLHRLIIKDGNHTRVDPTTFFSAKFPPVFFIHGTVDRVVPVRFTETAYNELKDLGVETEMRLVEGQDHAFDEKVGKEDANFAVIREGFQFLAKHAGASS